MRVAHLCLSCFFIDGRAYQENELVRQHHADGHEVLVIASTETHAPDGSFTYVEPSEYVGEEGVPIVRLAYHPWLPAKLGRKLRIHRGVAERLTSFRPDAILFHGLCGWELSTVARYAAAHPEVLVYADSHEDANNSARSFLSREFLHRGYYRAVLRRALPAIRKILCISTETMDFVERTYDVDPELLEFFPLGGHPVPDDDYADRRERVRAAYDIPPEAILFLQSGKQTVRKKLIESLKAFASVDDPRFRLIVAGTLFEEIRSEAERLIADDPRVTFVGWKSPDELTDLLCAADVYLQPGTQSVTMQNSLCARCAIIIDDVPSHRIYHRNNGWLIDGSGALAGIFADVRENVDRLPEMQAASYGLARELLDYRRLAQRVLRP